MKVLAIVFLIIIGILPGSAMAQKEKIPVILLTDLYYPAQDPGDNLDLIMGYALPEIDLRAIILDITDEFRKDSAFVFNLIMQRGGPREPGVIPVMQMNYLFDKAVPFAIGPMKPLDSADDKKENAPAFQQAGIDLLIRSLEQSNQPVHILSFGSARTIAAAYNRRPELLKEKVKMIHLSAGNSAYDGPVKSENVWDNIPGGEWNVALDVHAFVRLLRSDLPVSVYPCAGKKGVFSPDPYNTYWKMKDIAFVRQMDPRLQRYIDDIFTPQARIDYLGTLDQEQTFVSRKSPHHVWETAIWINVSGRSLVRNAAGQYRILPAGERKETDTLVSYRMQPCNLQVPDSGHFTFRPAVTSDKYIYYRPDPLQNEAALQEALPELYLSFKTKK